MLAFPCVSLAGAEVEYGRVLPAGELHGQPRGLAGARSRRRSMSERTVPGRRLVGFLLRIPYRLGSSSSLIIVRFAERKRDRVSRFAIVVHITKITETLGKARYFERDFEASVTLEAEG
jgi:hypothetical protein